MQILRYWKRVSLSSGVDYDLVAPTEITSDHSLYEQVIEALKSADMDYIIYERKEQIIERHVAPIMAKGASNGNQT